MVGLLLARWSTVPLWSMCTLSPFLTTCAHTVGLNESFSRQLGLRIADECQLFLHLRSMFLNIYSMTSHRMLIYWRLVPFKPNTTFNNGSLGSRIDEERSEMR
jgi:hypothetical protein